MPSQTAPAQQVALSTQNKFTVTLNIILQEIKAFFLWWYVEMPTWYMGLLQRVIVLCDDTFSISLLVKTFFIPWHRDKNWIGYFFGIAIRIIYLPMALFLSGLGIGLLLVVATLWALLPIISMVYLIRAPFI